MSHFLETLLEVFQHEPWVVGTGTIDIVEVHFQAPFAEPRLAFTFQSVFKPCQGQAPREAKPDLRLRDSYPELDTI